MYISLKVDQNDFNTTRWFTTADEGWKKEVVVTRSVLTADGLAADWVYSHLYWTDTGTNTISMSDFQGNMITVLIKDDLEEPRAIALHPRLG